MEDIIPTQTDILSLKIHELEEKIKLIESVLAQTLSIISIYGISGVDKINFAYNTAKL